MAMRIDTLNDLFFALFRMSDEGEEPVIRGHGRLAREELLQLFFPEELCRMYLDKTRSNLTWFFNDDPRNKAIRRSLIRLLEADAAATVTATHRKCMAVLFPQGQHAAFRGDSLREVLDSVRYPAQIRERVRLTGSDGAVGTLFEADPSAALARVILTLSLGADAPALTERIWSSSADTDQDGSPAGQLRRGNLLYLQGRRKEAFQIYEKLAQRCGQAPEELAMLCRMGLMLATGDGHYRDLKAAREHFSRAAAGGDVQAYYLLSVYSQGAEAAAALERAAQLGHSAAMRELGNAFHAGKDRPRDPEQAKLWFRKGMTAGGEDGAYCAYMLGRLQEESGDLPGALQLYGIARSKGSPEAWERLSRLEPEEEEPVPAAQPERQQTAAYCLTNGALGHNRVLLESLAPGWHKDTCAEGRVAQTLERLAGELFSPEAEVFPKLVIGLLGPDREDDLSQALEVLAVLERLARRLGDRKTELQEAVSIYLEGSQDYTALLLDAALGGRRTAIFPLQLCDSDWDSATELFTAAPLFLPLLKAPEDRQLRLTVLGKGDRVLALIRQAAALPLPVGCSTSIRVFAPDAAQLEQKLARCCPGLADPLPGSDCPQILFHPCDLEAGEAAALLRRLKQQRLTGEKLPGSSAAEQLGQGNYYIIATGDDREDLLLGTWLRETLLKLDPSFRALPFIAVQLRSPRTAQLAGSLSAGSSWHSRHDLFCYGSDSRYTLRSLQQDLTERRAQAVHLHYCPPELPRQQALESYYRRQYNRTSSRCAAMYLPYRLFAAGLRLPEERLYALPGELSRLSEELHSWLREPENVKAGARQEHRRWNQFMFAMGWERASVSQVQTYVQRGNPGHQLFLGKLHPFLCSWEELEDGKILAAVEDAVQSRFPDKKIQDPRIADEEMVLMTQRLLDII